MYSFSQFLKEIRKQGKLSQSDLAEVLGVSTILISMIEAGQKTASKKFLKQLAKKLEVHPGTIALFAYDVSKETSDSLSLLEKRLLSIGTQLQKRIVIDKVKNLKKDEKK